jgi:hypothetical protein
MSLLTSEFLTDRRIGMALDALMTGAAEVPPHSVASFWASIVATGVVPSEARRNRLRAMGARSDEFSPTRLINSPAAAGLRTLWPLMT